MTATKKHSKAKASGKHTTPVSTQQEANERFAESLGTQAKGSESGSIGAFIVLMDRVLQTTRSFSFGDVVNANKVFEIDQFILKKLYDKYTAAMQSFGVLDAVEGCYDEPVYFRLV